MALFKVSQGPSSNLNTQALTEGFCWFTPDDGKFYIDAKKNNTLTRIPLNAAYADASGEVHSHNIVPMMTKTYTNIIGTSNDQAGASFYFGKIRPNDWYQIWRIRYRVRVYVPGQNGYDQKADVLITGSSSSLRSYWSFNTIGASSTAYYHNLYRLKSTGYNAGYSHQLGIGLRSSTNPTNTSYKRTFEIEILETENCTFEFYDTCKAQNSTAIPELAGANNYDGVSEINFITNGLQETGDSDSLEDRQLYFCAKTSANKGIWAGSLFMEDGDGTYQGICTTSTGTIDADRTIATTKLANTAGFKVGGTVYYSNTTYRANSNITSWGVVYNQTSVFDARYSFNVTLSNASPAVTLIAYKPVYLVGTIHDDGLYYLDSTWWTQTPTDTSKIYVLVGGCYDQSNDYCRIVLYQHNPWYYYDGTRLQPYIDSLYVKQTSGVTAVTWDSTNNKLTRTINGSTADVVTIGTIKTALALSKSDVGLGNVPNVDTTNASNITSGTLAAARLATSGVTAGSYGPSANDSPAHGAGFSVPYFTVDNKGRVTAASTKTITLPPDTNNKVTQTNITATTSADYRILLSASTNDTTETNTSNKNTNLRFNTGTKTLSVGGNITATGDLTLTGDAYLNSNTYADGITAGSLLVNGNATFTNIPTSVTPAASSNDNSVATTAFVKTSVAGLSGAMHFRGITTVAMSDGSTIDPQITGYDFTNNKQQGDVIIDSAMSYEYVWTGAKWERLGPDGSYKTVQTAVTKPNAVTNKWVSAIGQNANGNIDVSYTTLDTTGTWQGNATTASTAAAVPWSGITGKPETYPPSSHTHAYLPLAGGTLTGDVIHNSGTGARKFYFSRGAGTGESTGVWVDDSYTYFDVTNDETTANVKFTLSATDSEGSDGSRAQTSYVIFNGANGKSTVRADYFVGDLTGNATTATTAAAVPWAGITGKPSTSISWGAGTTAGPTLTVTAAGSSSSAVAIPAASKTASGIVTTNAQNFVGKKGFGYLSRYGYDNTGTAVRYIGDTFLLNNAGTQVGEYWYDVGDAINITTGRWYWRQYSPQSTPDTTTTGKHETYSLPTVTNGLTENKSYSILTTKNLISIAQGGTGASTAGGARTNLGLGSMATEIATDYIKKSTLSGAYDIMYSSAANTPTNLAANTTTTKKFLRMTGTGSAGAAPAWDTVTKSDVGLGNVTNHAQVTAVTWDSTNKKLQQSVSGGTATDIVTIGTIKNALALAKGDVGLGNVPNVDATNASNITTGTLAAARLATSGVTAASYGPSSNTSPAHGGGFSVPYLTIDKYGRITAASTKTITLPLDDTVMQNNTTTNADYRIILSGGANDTSERGQVNKSTNLRFNPSTKIFSVGGNITATGDLSITGDTTLSGETSIASATVGALEVTGNATFTQIPQSVTPGSTSNDNSVATTAFVKTSVAGLAGAMHFKGITTVNITDGSTTDPLITGYNFSTDKAAGDVIIDGNQSAEYVWTGSKWERLGPDNTYKLLQTAITKPNAVTNQWVSAIGQDANGNLSIDYASLNTSGTWNGNAATATTASKLSNTSKIGDTNKPVYFTASGVPAAISYTIDKSVPSNAVFTDSNVSQSASTTARWRKVLLHYTADAASTTAVSSSTNVVYAAVGVSVQPSTGTLRTTAYNVADHVTIQYNSTTQALDFIFN